MGCRRTKRLGAAGIAAAALLAAGCGGSDNGASSTDGGGKRLKVVAAFYPVEEAARMVGGQRVSVANLTPPGGEPHDVELSSDSAAALEESDLVLFLSDGFQPAVEKAVANLGDSTASADVLAGIALRDNDPVVPGVKGEVDEGELATGKDPHVWVDPAVFSTMVEKIRDAMIAADPDGEETYRANADGYLAKLRTLDDEFEQSLESCKGKVLVTSHAAFGYLADRYGLVQAPIAGISPEDEPDPKSLAATASFAKKHGVKTVFFETLVPKDLAETVASEIGATTDALDPAEGIPQDALDKGASYLTIQRDNLRRLVKGLACTTA